MPLLTSPDVQRRSTVSQPASRTPGTACNRVPLSGAIDTGMLEELFPR